MRAAIEQTEKVVAEWVSLAPVHLEYEGCEVWTGSVHVFSLGGHPKAPSCYAWESEMDDGAIRTYVVLHIPPVDSPEAAVRAAIAADYRAGREQ